MVVETIRRRFEPRPEFTIAESKAIQRVDEAWVLEQRQRGEAWNRELETRLHPFPSSAGAVRRTRTVGVGGILAQLLLEFAGGRRRLRPGRRR